MAEYNLKNTTHNEIGDPHPQYDFNTLYTSKYSGSNLGARVKLFEMPITYDVTSIIQNDYYSYTGVQRLNIGFKLTATVSGNAALIGDAYISTFVTNNTNDDITFSDSDNFRGYATIDWQLTDNYRAPFANDARLELSIFVKKDTTYRDDSGVSRYIVSVYSSMHQYGSVSVQPTHISWGISRKTADSGVGKTTAWSTTNPFANPHSNTKDKFDWIFGKLPSTNLMLKTDFDAMRSDTTNVRIPVLEKGYITIMDSYSSIDVKKITDTLHMPLGSKYQVEIRNSPIVNGPSGESNNWAYVEIVYTPAQRVVTIYYPSNNAYRATENGYNSNVWSDWKAI